MKEFSFDQKFSYSFYTFYILSYVGRLLERGGLFHLFQIKEILSFKCRMARSHGLVVEGEGLQLKGRGFESWHRIIDGL